MRVLLPQQHVGFAARMCYFCQRRMSFVLRTAVSQMVGCGVVGLLCRSNDASSPTPKFCFMAVPDGSNQIQ
jgi:hypothetical protein